MAFVVTFVVYTIKFYHCVFVSCMSRFLKKQQQYMSMALYCSTVTIYLFFLESYILETVVLRIGMFTILHIISNHIKRFEMVTLGNFRDPFITML